MVLLLRGIDFFWILLCSVPFFPFSASSSHLIAVKDSRDNSQILPFYLHLCLVCRPEENSELIVSVRSATSPLRPLVSSRQSVICIEAVLHFLPFIHHSFRLISHSNSLPSQQIEPLLVILAKDLIIRLMTDKRV